MTSILFYSILSGCIANGEFAPAGSTIEFNPESVTLSYGLEGDITDPLEDQDLSGRLVMVDAYVTYTNERWPTAQPLDNVLVEITSMHDGVYIIPQAAVQIVDQPQYPADINSYEELRDLCTVDGAYNHEAGDWCAWYWDTDSQTFFQFDNEYADAETTFTDPDDCDGAAPCDYFYGPTYMRSTTDNRGLLRLYLFVDTLPDSGSAQIYGSLGVHSNTLMIFKEENSTGGSSE